MLVATKKLRAYIKKKKTKDIKWKQKDLAKKLGCTDAYLSDLINGKRTNPSIKFASKLEVVTRTVKIKDWSKDA